MTLRTGVCAAALAAEQARPVAVVLDVYEAVGGLGGEEAERHLRGLMRRHDGVSWVQLATEFSLAVRAQGAGLGRAIATPLASLERDVDLTVNPDVEGDSGSQAVVSSSVSMAQPTPNPFNPRTEVSFSLPHQARVDLQIYDVRGRRVRTLVSGVLGGGAHRVVWDGTDDVHQAVASGVYFMKLVTDSEVLTRRMTLIR